MTEARIEILNRLRSALADVPDRERPEDVTVTRDYAQAGAGSPGLRDTELVDRLQERIEGYQASVRRVGSADLASAIAAALEQRSARRVAVPDDLPGSWLARTGCELLPSTRLSHATLEAVDGVVTGCAVAVAETGTIVLDSGVAQGRRELTLLPDYHLCVVRHDQIVSGIPHALTRLDPRRPLTWISGPSATSDIEMHRVEGVHGPRTLEVLIVTT
ncbi:LUD domain-containing protein [Lipingzhangella sp. LS1_29]|uniref:LUD domain-containing protein n=1 Tax=Lipingzhangella rawalii TaxID=2055835 RepID=A0ABU2H1N1_9ACTN|nr:LUD domain-containing protein [Lipingzhangella rawalii]MDS1269201.1 LUD domain-containing protein [Lipingzhangella rawalii]